MTYIKKILIENFQSHKYTELEFSKGMNVIVGHSDSGKTSILRAIRWCLYNEPGGTDFIREGQAQARVELVLQNNTSIIRLRSKSKNQYILKSPTEELVFEGFGLQVPQEIIEASGIQKTSFDDKKSISLNYSAQLDGPFLLNESDSYKASAIGRLVGVNIIDDTMRSTLRDKKQMTSEIAILNRRKDSLSEKLDTFSFLEEYNELKTRLQSLFEQIKKKEESVNLLRDIYNKFLTLQTSIDYEKRILDNLQKLPNLEEIIEKVAYINKKQVHLQDLENQYKKIELDKIHCKSTIERHKNLDFLDESSKTLTLKMTHLRNLQPIYSRYHENAYERNQLEKIIRQFEKINKISLDQVTEKVQLYNRQKELLDSVYTIRDRVHMGEEYLQAFKPLDEIQLDSITEKVKRLNAFQSLEKELYKLREEYNKTQDQYMRAEKSYKIIEAQYLDQLKKLGRCPLCNQNIDENALNHISHNLQEVNNGL